MKNRKFTRALTLVLSCLLLIGVAFGITAMAQSSDTNTVNVEIAYKNVSYAGSPKLVYYVKADKALEENQQIKVLYWTKSPNGAIFNEYTADYIKESSATVGIDGVEYEAFLSEGIAPYELRKAVYARPVVVDTADGSVVSYGEVLEYSIFDYAVDMFKNGATSDQESVYSCLLDYAASIQTVLFTNPYNGVVDEKKLKEAGDWADAYYILFVEKYIYNEETKDYEATGEYDPHYTRGGKKTVKAEYNYTVDGVVYGFAGYQYENGEFIYGETVALPDNFGNVEITKTALSKREYTVDLNEVGVKVIRAAYIPDTGALLTFDEGDIGDFATASDFWKQYGVSAGVMTAKDLKTVTITRYFYGDHEIKHFYTPNGLKSDNIEDYKYACIDTTTKKPVTKKIENPSDSKYLFIDVTSDSSITKTTHTVHSSGYIDSVSDPVGAAGNKVLKVTKHIYDLGTNNPMDIFTPGARTNNTGNGFVEYLGQLDGKSNVISGVSAGIVNKSPKISFDPDNYATTIFESDICLDAYTGNAVIQLVFKNSAGDVIWEPNFVNNTVGGKEFSLTIEAGPGNDGGSKTIYDANGNLVSKELIAGQNGGTTVGDSLYHNTWYNFRFEYTAEANDYATIKVYVNGELVSFIRDKATSKTTDGVTTYNEDDYISRVEVFALNDSRKTNIYLDNTYLGTRGGDVPEKAVVDYYEPVYDSDISSPAGKYTEDSEKFDNINFRPANNPSKNHIFVTTETNEETGETNNRLDFFRETYTGETAAFPSIDGGGNYYIFETDLKVIGADNTSQWMMKFQFLNKAATSPANTNEFLMVCLMYKDGYFTISNLNTVLNSDAKFKLDEWHNVRFEYNPIDGKMKIFVNNYCIYDAVYSLSETKNPSAFAGVGVNIRQYPEGTEYTHFALDNVFCSTLYLDSQGAGDNYTESEKYDSATNETGMTVVEDNGNKYISANDYTIEGTPAHNRGHNYIFETDINWNSISGLANATDTAKVLSLKFYTGATELIEVYGMVTGRENSDLIIKVGTQTVASIINQLWMNLRVVYAPAEPVLAEDGETIVYGGTYTVYINNSAVYTANVGDLPNLTFDKVTLHVGCEDEGVTPTIFIDNTFFGTKYVDDHKNGENYTSSEQFIKEKVDGDYLVVDNHPIKTETSIGTKYIAETDIKWWNGDVVNGTVFKYELMSTKGAFLTIYGIADATNPGYVKLSTSENAEDAFFEIYQNTWYNIQVVAADGDYQISVSGKTRTAIEMPLGADFLGFNVKALNNTIVYIDNCYVSVENKNYSSNGANKIDAYTSYIDADNAGLLEYNKIYAEADPNGIYTDSYVDIERGAVTLGKNTAMEYNYLKFLNGAMDGTTHVFETDLVWAASINGVETPIAGTDVANYYTMTLLGADGAELLTIYAVGVYNIDTVDTEAQFLKLYTSLEDVKNDNAFAYISADVYFNIRVEYSSTGEYKIFINNKEVLAATGVASEVMSGVIFELGEDVYDAEITFKNTYIASK